MLSLGLRLGLARRNVADVLPAFLKSSTFLINVANASSFNESGGFVGSIADLSSSNNHFTETGSSKFPAYDAVNALLDFDGTNDSLESFVIASPTIHSAVTLPDASGSVAGVGFTNTGLFQDTDMTWWMGNDGRGASSDTTHEPSIVHLTSDFSSVISEIDVHTIEPSATTVQGIARHSSDDTIFFTLPQEGLIVNCNKQGVEQYRLPSTDAQGVDYDPVNDMLYIIRSSGVLRRIRLDGTTHQSFGTMPGSNWDKLLYDQGRNGLWLTQGSNGSDGNVYFFDLETSSLSEPLVLQGADAIEGAYLVGNTLYVNNDAYFHNGNPALNRVLRYHINPNHVVQTAKKRGLIDFACVFQMDGANSSADAIFSSGNPLNEEGFAFYIADSTTFRVWVNNGSSDDYVDFTVNDMATLSLINVNIDLSSGLVTLYQNNLMVGTQSLTGVSPTTIRWARMQIADSPDSRNASIKVRAMRLNDQVMSEDERAELVAYLSLGL